MPETQRVVDITPTWAGVLPVLLAAYSAGTDEGRRMAEIELRRMAKLADAFAELAPAE